MAKQIASIANKLGATIVGQVPDVGGGAFGAARLAELFRVLRGRLEPSQGKRPGRPSDPMWSLSPKVPMSEQTHQSLVRLAEMASDEDRKVTAMQMAAQLLEHAVQQYHAESGA